MIVLPQRQKMSVGSTELISVDLSDTLDSSETISSVTSVTETTSLMSSVTGEGVKSSSWTHKDGSTVPASQGVAVTVTASSLPGHSILQWIVVTSSSRTLKFATHVIIE